VSIMSFLKLWMPRPNLPASENNSIAWGCWIPVIEIRSFKIEDDVVVTVIYLWVKCQLTTHKRTN
jgi:hypothetical protein